MDEAGPQGGIAREFAALGLVALAAYGFLSLACLDLGRQPNLGGPLGSQLAELLSFAFGYQSYVLMILIAALARRVWMAAPALVILRTTAGGTLLLLALSAAGGFWRIGEVSVGGAAGEMIAGAIGAYLNVGGGYIVVMLALVGGMALVAGRAPTDLAASVAGATRWRGRGSAVSAEAPESSAPLEAALADARSATDTPLVRRTEKPSKIAREKKTAGAAARKGCVQTSAALAARRSPAGAFES